MSKSSVKKKMFVVDPMCEPPGVKVISIFMDQTMFNKVWPVSRLVWQSKGKMGNVNNQKTKEIKNLVSRSKEVISREMQDRLKSKVIINQKENYLMVKALVKDQYLKNFMFEWRLTSQKVFPLQTSWKIQRFISTLVYHFCQIQRETPFSQ